ncbi:ribbon-helix-helix domain-containing protein [Roseomonas sp. USHLN139]|uniref:ribbon-helix-helix domain-containing protein n=1 Tax=Roseomonas sp. USHLN139 TaxID=3081298 RepID=UPI003B011D38
MSRPNALQAILDREAAAAAEPTPSPKPVAAKTVAKAPRPQPAAAEPSRPTPAANGKAFHRPSREGRRFLGGHFTPDVLRQMKMLAVEEDTTTQALLEEALNLLFVKKGKGKIVGV